MKRDSLDSYDVLPPDMISYLNNYGRHFNQKLLKFAVSKMKKRDKQNTTSKITPITKEELDSWLSSYGIHIENNQMCDYLYVANMCKADFLHRSIPDEQHLCMYVKDVIDDVDAYDGIVFNRWYADTRRLGIAIDWEEML